MKSPALPLPHPKLEPWQWQRRSATFHNDKPCIQTLAPDKVLCGNYAVGKALACPSHVNCEATVAEVC